MKLDHHTYPKIKASCDAMQPVEFDVERSSTAFANSPAPTDWTAYPPAHLSKDDYDKVFAHASLSSDVARGRLTTLELDVHLRGGRILYRENGPDVISLRITWPARSKE